MNDNPAKLLYERLVDWSTAPPNSTARTQRQTESKDWIDAHIEALSWMELVIAHLQQINWDAEQVEDLRNKIADCIFVSERGLDGATGAVTRTFIPSSALALISLTAASWNGPAWLKPSSENLSQMLEATTGLKLLIADATYLDGEARSYLLDLLESFDKAITRISVCGAAEIRKLAAELIGALGIYLSDANEEDRSKVNVFFTKLVKGVKEFLRIAVSSGIEGAAGYALGALTTGL